MTHGTHILVPVPVFWPVLPLLPNLCLPSPQGFGGQPETVQRLLPWSDAKRPLRRQNRGTEAPLISGLGLLSVNPLPGPHNSYPNPQNRSVWLGLEDTDNPVQHVYGHNASMLCRCQFPSGIQISKAKSHQHGPRDTTHERKTTGHRNRPLLSSLLCVWVLDDARSSSLIRSWTSDFLKMHIKNKWIRSALFASSGLMFAIGTTKMGDQASALIVITGGLISLAALVSRVPDQEQ